MPKEIEPDKLIHISPDFFDPQGFVACLADECVFNSTKTDPMTLKPKSVEGLYEKLDEKTNLLSLKMTEVYNCTSNCPAITRKGFAMGVCSNYKEKKKKNII